MHIYTHTHTRTKYFFCSPLKLTACAWICATVLVFQPPLLCFIQGLFVLAMQVSAGLFGSRAVQGLNISGIAVWLTLKITRFSLDLLLSTTVFYLSQVYINSGNGLWQVVFTRLIDKWLVQYLISVLPVGYLGHFILSYYIFWKAWLYVGNVQSPYRIMFDGLKEITKHQDGWGIKKANVSKYWIFYFGPGLFDTVRENLFLFSVTELWTKALSLSAFSSQIWKIWLGTSVKPWTTPPFYEATYGELGLCHFLQVFERSLSAVLSKVWSLTEHVY